MRRLQISMHSFHSNNIYFVNFEYLKWTGAHMRQNRTVPACCNLRHTKYFWSQGKNVTLSPSLTLLPLRTIAPQNKKKKLHNPHANSHFWGFLKLMIESDTVRSSAVAFKAGSASVTTEIYCGVDGWLFISSSFFFSGTPRTWTLFFVFRYCIYESDTCENWIKWKLCYSRGGSTFSVLVKHTLLFIDVWQDWKHGRTNRKNVRRQINIYFLAIRKFLHRNCKWRKVFRHIMGCLSLCCPRKYTFCIETKNIETYFRFFALNTTDFLEAFC